jgi:hypothetical protein
LWLIGHEREAARTHTRVFPFYWRNTDAPYSESTLILPLWYSRNSPTGNTRFYSLLYGYIENGDVRSDYVLAPIFYMERSKTTDYYRSGIFLLYDWRSYEDGRRDFTFINILGLAYLFKAQTGLPPDGETVGSLGRESSRRIELLNLLGFVSLMAYDDVGDTREFRFLTLFSSEVISLVRSWRGRGGDPFVREWVFPVYMNIQDAQSGWSYVGPLWGTRTDRLRGEHTDWWLLGLTSCKRTPDGDTWKILGLPIFTTDPDPLDGEVEGEVEVEAAD